MAVIAVDDKFIAVARGLYIDCYDYKIHNAVKVESEEENDSISDIVIGTTRPYLAVLTSASKQLIVYDLPLLAKVKSYLLPRSASKIRFSKNNDCIYVADKTGDILMYNITKEDNGKKLLGHLSMLLNVLETNDSKYIISSDRDEKIRVSCYPNSYNIQTYCLGHKEFVNHLELLPHNDNYLTSTSGDGTIKCWDYKNGKLCHSIDTFLDINDESLKKNFAQIMTDEGIEVNSLPIVSYAITKAGHSCSIIAVTVYSLNKILFYALETNSTNNFDHQLVYKLDFEQNPTAFKFKKMSFFIYNSNKNTVEEYHLKYDKQNFSLEHASNIPMFLNNGETNIISLENNSDSIKLLYKRKFDNVQEYRERKKQRLEKV